MWYEFGKLLFEEPFDQSVLYFLLLNEDSQYFDDFVSNPSYSLSDVKELIHFKLL